ncbi:MAG: mechanosensitive ion channel domain-containing protein, partial [Planctomycetota bacterium]
EEMGPLTRDPSWTRCRFWLTAFLFLATASAAADGWTQQPWIPVEPIPSSNPPQAWPFASPQPPPSPEIATRQPPIKPVAAFLPLQDNDESDSSGDAPNDSVELPIPLDAPLNNLPAVAEAIQTIADAASIDEVLQKRAVETLGELQETLKSRQKWADQLAAINKELATISIKTEVARAAADKQPSIPEINTEFKMIEQVAQERTAAKNQLTAAQEDLRRIDEAIANRTDRIEKLPTEIADARKRVDELKNASVGKINDDPDGLLRMLMTRQQQAALVTAESLVEKLIAEQTLYESQTDLLPLQRTAQEKKVAVAEAVFRAWSIKLSEFRQSQIEKDLKAFKQELTDKGIDPGQSYILSRETEWLDTVHQTESVDQKVNIEQARSIELTEERRQRIEEIESSISRTGALPSSLGLKLQLLRRRLPSIPQLRSQIDEVNEQIENARQMQTELDLVLERAAVRNGAPPLSGQLPITGLTPDGTPFTTVTPSEVSLIEQFRQDLSKHQNRLLDLQTQLESQRASVVALLDLIDTNVVWIRNQSPLRWSDLGQSWEALRWIVKPQHWWLLSGEILRGFFKRLELLVILLVCIGAIVFAGKRLRQRITMYGKRAQDRASVTLRPTLAATLISLSLVLPLATIFFVIGEALSASTLKQPLVAAAQSAFRLAAIAVLPLELLRQCLRPGGLAVAHFSANENALRGTRRWLRILIDIGLPLLLLFGIADGIGQWPSAEAMARLVLIAGMVFLSVFLWQTLEPRRGILSMRIAAAPDSWLARLKYVWFGPIVAIPLVLALVAVMGYGSGARVLIERLYWTLWLALLSYFVGGIVRRWLLTQRRRLTLAVHRERLEESQRLDASNAQGVEVEPTTTMAASEINAQTSRLVQTFLFIGALIGVAWIWTPVLPAVKYLDGVELWSVESERGKLTPITLANLVVALPVVVLTWASVRNLPGLVEGFLLERLPLDKPARYAITTLGTYALATIGILISSQALGVRWDNIQWLVAALGVGLGFGLQEIFANFISGLILLFEQPIRIGDIVTLGDTTGVVARIRMRATTVTNWDRQELIIPNKDLITGRLVNWTLSDSMNRVVINVGVAYGSNTDQACDLLKEICNAHPRIADDPAPLVTFEGFGDSTLNLVVRCFLSTLDERLLTIHQLHTDIHNRFNEAGIEIAFPQRDLHLRSCPPEVVAGLSQIKAA